MAYSVLHHCSGGHYGDQPQCRWSGYAREDIDATLERLQRATDASYAAFAGAGLTEEQILAVVIVEESVATSLSSVTCGDVASAATIAAVEARNRWILGHYPNGVLWGRLMRPTRRSHRLYYRTQSEPGVWHHVEHAMQTAAPGTIELLRGALTAEVPPPSVELRALLVSDDDPPACIAEEALRIDEAAELRRARMCPLIPDGHLQLSPTR